MSGLLSGSEDDYRYTHVGPEPLASASAYDLPLPIVQRTRLAQYTEEEIVSALLQGGGDFNIASTLLHPLITADELKLYTARNRNIYEALKDYHRISTLADLSRLSHMIHLEIGQRLDEIAPTDLIKNYSSIIERMLDLLDGRFKGSSTNIQNNIAVGDALLKSLPPDVRNSVIELLAEPDLDLDSEPSDE